MTTRLDRLFLLLETGSSPVTRKAAALQLGEVQKLHPHELHNLLNKVRHYLHSNNWETRIAAGQAVEAIVSNVPQWKPTGLICEGESKKDDTKVMLELDKALAKENKDGTEMELIPLKGRMTFESFDIIKVMQNGKYLLGSEGNEYELHDEASGSSPKVFIADQRLRLNQKLGLDLAEKMGIDTQEIFTNEDLVSKTEESNSSNKKKTPTEIFESEMSQSPANSKSSRRRSRVYSKQLSREPSYLSNQSLVIDEAPPIKKTKSVLVEQPSTEDTILLDNVPDNEALWEESREWPFASFCNQLANDLFNPVWEIRHGAATALREIVKVHGKGAGRQIDVPAEQMELLNQLWLEDMSLRLLCVLALDKFGDFVSDQVVAPVRETCAQALGSIFNLLWSKGIDGMLQILLQLMVREQWEARHGGLLGLKYLLVVREDMRSQVIPVVFEQVFHCLQDPIDDVSAAAAATLVPVTKSLVSVLPEKVSSVVSILWSMIQELDDLTSSTSNILLLLASLLSHPTKSISSDQSLTDLVPRLWPFLSHNSSVVRSSVLQMLAMLTGESNPQPCDVWLLPILPDALRLLFQRCLIEHCSNIHDLLFKVWYQIVTHSSLTGVLNAACPFLSSWLCLLMHPSRVAIDPNVIQSWLVAKRKIKMEKSPCNSRKVIVDPIAEQFYIGGSECLGDNSKDFAVSVIQARCMAARFLGLISMYVTKPVPGIVYTPEMESPVDCYAKLILFHLNSKSALQRLAVGLVLLSWARLEDNNVCPESIKSKCLSCLNENIYFDEIALAFTRMQQECKDFMAFIKHHKLPLDTVFQPGNVLTLEKALELSGNVLSSLTKGSKLKPKILEMLESRRKSLYRTVIDTQQKQVSYNIVVQSSLACALVALKFLPDKLNPLIRPLMESLKKEENSELQASSALSLVNLMELCISRTPCPNPKIIKNLIGFLVSHPQFDSCLFSCQSNSEGSSVGTQTGKGSNALQIDKYRGIFYLYNMQKTAEKSALRRSTSMPGRKPANYDQFSEEALKLEDENQKQSELQHRGAVKVFAQAAQHFGPELPNKLLTLWEGILKPLMDDIDPKAFDSSAWKDNDSQAQVLLNNLLLLKVTGPSLHPSLHNQLEELLPYLVCCLEHPYTTVRHASAQCVGMLSTVITQVTLTFIVEKILPFMESTGDCTRRQGAVEAIACVIEQLALRIVPYVVLLVVPMLGRMSDQNEAIRLLATHCFASLIRLMPLEMAIKDPPLENDSMKERKAIERQFLDQLLDPKKLSAFKVEVPIQAELRSYQQAGVNWLAFLNKYKLHGILCDDMGLGKTLQSICILAADHNTSEKRYKENPSMEKPLPSLVVCPPTLTGHWVYEVDKFVSPLHLNPLHYTGPPNERTRLRGWIRKHNLVIASYDIVRNDIDFFGSVFWNYCILDEGHIIKNGKTKLSRAIKQLQAKHRLILSGTPIQNNVLELWSLFDFLMPGFLGTEKQFTARYSKPILQSRDAKSSSKEQEAGVLAMESLHRQVLPFLLRRMKEDVLQDLPPKIIQDYYCELSPLQVQLYEDFAKSRARLSLEESIKDEDGVEDEKPTKNTSHIFQALQYLRKVCNHPKLVLTAQHPEFERVTAQLKVLNSSLHDPSHAAKLSALKQLLLDCGIGATGGSGSSEPECAVNPHRALVFCQLKSMLDILEKDLFRSQMPGVAYLRLDGSIPAGSRHAVVHRFNNDPSIDVLLLTTQVGGLGLNLTGADTVIFVEHDWNPMKDLQAMDRAHRIGQKRVVNVYRLITRGTLEEKIMGLQKFKLNIASTVISHENASLQSMGTEQLLDLFNLDDNNKKHKNSYNGDSAEPKGKGMKSLLENMPELWDSEQYDSEYDINGFLASLNQQ